MAKFPISRRTVIKTLAAGGVGVGVNAAAPYVIPEQPGFAVNTSYWSLALADKNPAPSADVECDIAIIGGGYTGLSTAFYARALLPSARVVVLEAERCGNGASGRNGAMLMNLTSDSYLDTDQDAALFGRLYRLTLENIQRIDALSKRFGIDCDLELNGTLVAGENKSDADQFAAVAAAAKHRGVPMELWNADQVRGAVGTRAYTCGLYEPNSGQLHPGKLVRLWKTAAQSSGALIYEGSIVRHIEPGERLRLQLDDGRTVRAGKLVLAANAYGSKLGYLRNAVVPIINHVAITEPVSAELLTRCGWRRRVPFCDNRINLTYLGLTRDGRIHIGGGTEQYQFNNGVRPPDTEVAVARLRREFERLFPELTQVSFERNWWGLVDMSIDQTPAVGRLGSHENIYFAVGLSGQGINLSSVLGRILADLIAGNGAQWSWFPYLNRMPPYIPNEPLRWLGVRAVLAFTQ
jgi:gamma-glutamylputrescine oxidase